MTIKWTLYFDARINSLYVFHSITKCCSMQGHSDNNPTYFQMSHIWHILPKIEIKRYKPKPIHQVNDSIIYECNLMDVFPNYGSIINVCSLMIVPCFFPNYWPCFSLLLFFNPKKIRKKKKKKFWKQLSSHIQGNKGNNIFRFQHYIIYYKGESKQYWLCLFITSWKGSPNNIDYPNLFL